MGGLLLKAKRVEEKEEGEEETVEGVAVAEVQCKGLHVPPAEEEGRGKRRVQAPIRLTFDAPGKPPKSALAGVALMVGDDEESDHEECALRSSPVEMPGEPATLKEALESSDAEDWKKAMESELKSIEENGTWELVELPEGRKAITSKWLFKINSDPNGKIERYNSRNIAKGYLQNEKVEFKALFAHLLKPTMLRTLLARAAIKGWVVKRMDVKTAFLNHILEEEIFMAQLEGFDDDSGRLSFMVVYVDDILIFLPSSDLVKEVMLKLQDKFKCKALGDGPEEESVGEEERCRFHLLLGSLIYAAVNTRPDVAFVTEQLARGADGVEPGRLFLTAFSDASYASEPEDMTSVGGFICCVGGGPTAWESKKQVDRALSSVESEYKTLFRAVREIVWRWRLLAELGEEQQGPTPLYCDRQGAIDLAKNPVLHGLTKHMRVKWHWTRSIVATGEVELRYVKTMGQPADMMTKRLVEQQHWKCCKLARMALN
ncbi:unnamed protein product [Closterium sp. NIES-53]